MPTDENHEELQNAIQENVAEKSISTEAEDKGSIGASAVGSGKPNTTRPQDRNLSTRAEQSAGTRGMNPSYTKSPPPPRANSNRTVDEIQSYLKFILKLYIIKNK